MDDIVLKGYIQIKCSNPGRLKRKAWRKRWLVIEFPTWDSDEERSSSILVRVYVSHHHENKGPPAFCIPILDVHALHRIQSRSQPYAFSIDGSSGELLAAGQTETDSQAWMFDIRLRGFYGIVHVDKTSGEIVLTEARSGEEQVRWKMSSINRVFCPKTVCKRDKNKILVIITNRNKSNGEGIFTFYSEEAPDILKDVKYSKSPKRKSLAAEAVGGRETGNRLLKNPLTYLFKRDSSLAVRERGETVSKQEKGRRKVLEKSVSMMEDFGGTEKITRQNKKELIKELKSSSLMAKSSSLTRTKSRPSELDNCYYSCDEFRSSDTPSPPPFPSPPDSNIKEILSSGQYYSFNKGSTYSPLDTVKSRTSEHETSAELLNIERSLYELSQRQQRAEDGGAGQSNVRNSFLSVDSGRNSSDTYDTSNSSVSSSGTNHSNRLNSTASNCSGDSGTVMSLGSGECPGTTGSVLSNIQETAASVISSSSVSTVRLGSSEKSKDSGLYGSLATEPEAPPPLPPRYATIRKSFTLPHNMAGAADNRIYDNPLNLKPDPAGLLKQVIRPRPSSLSVEKRQFLRSVSQENSARSMSSMTTFSCRREERSRSLQRGGQVRAGRSVSSEAVRPSLSHSTPQGDSPSIYMDLDLAPGRVKTWRSNDGLITPVSLGGCSPYQTPHDSPANSPATVSRFQPQFFTRVPLAASRAKRRDRGLLSSSGSVSSLNNPLRDLATVVMNERCNSIPRSCTTDVLYRTGNQPRPGPAVGDNERHSVREQSVRDTKSVGGTKSLENIINQARLEAEKERLALQQKAPGEEIYLDMSRLNKSSDYLEMERLQHFQNFNAKN